MSGTLMRKIAASLIFGVAPLIVAAQGGYPARPIKIVVPASPGGDTDIIARIVADLLARDFKQPVLVENKAGAGGQLGIQSVIHASPDGYTVGLVWQAAATVVPYLQAKMPFNPTEDFLAVARLATTSNALIVTSDSPLTSVNALIDQARKAPGSVSYASWGIGTGGHLAGALINQQAKTNMLHVPYKGSPEAVQAVIAKEVQFGIVGYGTASTQSKGGKVRVLGVLEKHRSQFFPDAPALTEAGYPISQVAWFGVIAPKKTPPAVALKLESALMAVANNPMMTSKLATLAITPAPMAGAEFAKQIDSDFEGMRELVKTAGIQKN